MGSSRFILQYFQSCATGTLVPSECGPFWQMAVIAVLLLIFSSALVVMRLRTRSVLEKA